MTTGFRDLFSAHAADYREFRPSYPPKLFTFLASLAPSHDLAWDCGTGNGQAAIGLAEHFTRVFATDASADQIRNAPAHPRVEYAVAPAERCPLADHSADIVMVAQALHWFDLDRFYAEVRRVGRSGALLAATCYYEPSVGPGVDEVLRRWEACIRPYWTPERTWVDAGYRTMPFPLPELPSPQFALSVESNLPRFLGYVSTWSATKQYIKAHGSDPLKPFVPDFTCAWGDPADMKSVRWQFNVRLGRLE